MQETLRDWVLESRSIVFFGGAGTSTESGIPDFRSVDGLYHQKYAYPPETILSHSFFISKPEEFFRFYREKMLVTNVEPNAAHRKLAQWERDGRLLAVVTQNIDGLHQKAGSQKVLELHGSLHRNSCMKCGKNYAAEALFEFDSVPVCACGGVIKPDVVLYGETLDERVIEEALRVIEQADLLIVGGTSLSVYPAAGLITVYRGKRLVLINKTSTRYDRNANLVIHEPIGELFQMLP